MISLDQLSLAARETAQGSDDLPVGGGFKRFLDICAGVSGIIVLSPLLLMLTVLIKFSDGGSVFYGHRRIGFGGEVFKCWKFRTMVEKGDAVLAEYLSKNPEARLAWEEEQKLENDPRVTPIGHVLRKLSLDELPQLFNILVGDMSLVGPRPVVNDELKRYGRALHCYLASRPGLTGLWQVSGRSDVSYQSRVAFDQRYVETWSVPSDIVIIFKTIPAVLMQKGSR
ncbi:MAG: sugar transferase [Hyphomicrobiales bacterium]